MTNLQLNWIKIIFLTDNKLFENRFTIARFKYVDVNENRLMDFYDRRKSFFLPWLKLN